MKATHAVVLSLLLLGIAGCGRSPSFDQVQAFDHAAESLRRATTPQEHLAAAAEFETLRAGGLESGVLYYDLGNAYLSGGRRAEAIAAYRQAELYRPRDPYLAANLSTALGGAPLARPVSAWSKTLLFWKDWLGYHEMADLAVLGAALTLVLLVTAAFVPRGRSGLRWSAIFPAVVCLATTATLLLRWQEHVRTERGVIASEVIARKGDDESFAPAINEALAEGREFVVRERRASWLSIELPGGLEGWIPERAAVTYRTP